MSTTKRSNYLVDRPFQFKVTALVVGLTLIIGVPLGFLVLRSAQEAVDIGTTANQSSTEALKQAELMNTRLAMEASLHVGGQSPEVVAQLKKENEAATEGIRKQGEATRAEGAKLQRVRTSLFAGIAGGMGALILLVVIAGIYLTHKISGPIHRMRSLFAEVSEGKFSPYRPLRKGDELQDFFADFSNMVEKLKERQKAEVARLDEAIAKAAKAGVSDGSLYDLKVVRDAMEHALTSKPSETKIET